jgi:cytochrome c oxidase assembly protein subunit 15
LMPAAADSPWLATFLFGFVCLQGAFGAWTVTLKLQPVIVTTHLLLGLSLLGILAWLKARQDGLTLQDGRAEAIRVASQVANQSAAALRWPARLALCLLALQLALGGWVSTNYATLACNDFPLCHGQLIPEMDYAHGFTLWRQLGMTAGGDYLPFSALTAIHWTHRNFAFVVIAVLAWVALRARAVPGLRRNGSWLLGALGLQFATGVATIYLQYPLALAVMHNAGAALLVLLLVMLNYKTSAAARMMALEPDLQPKLQPHLKSNLQPPSPSPSPSPTGQAFSTPAKQ